jgi:hypothetical protein
MIEAKANNRFKTVKVKPALSDISALKTTIAVPAMLAGMSSIPYRVILFQFPVDGRTILSKNPARFFPA